MASGYGFSGPNRCFTFWQDFLKCHNQADSRHQCDPQREDYLECLHPYKEETRMRIILDEAERQKKTNAKSSDKVLDLNLLSPTSKEES
ncbi:hypothetical protein H4R35_005308 [Dimargaris xerosporica]|nr:hypothetical protein H4R35_005308 [Dimargaris xerosporica]